MNRTSGSESILNRSILRPTVCFAAIVLGGASAAGGVVDFRLATLPAPSAMSTSMSVPASQTSFTAGSTIHVEVWVQTSHANGLSSASLDVSFDPSLATAVAITHSSVFSTLTHAVINNGSGTVDDLSGSHLGPCSDAIALAPNWARLAIIEMTADADGPLTLQSLSSGSPVYGTAVCAIGDVDPAQISYGAAAVQIGDAPIPAMSAWGACILTLALLIAASNLLARRNLTCNEAGPLKRTP